MISGSKGLNPHELAHRWVKLQMAENKKRISIEVNADFHRELKLFATLRGMSIQSYITTLIQNDMKNMK